MRSTWTFLSPPAGVRIIGLRVLLALALAACNGGAGSGGGSNSGTAATNQSAGQMSAQEANFQGGGFHQGGPSTATPVKHVVVIFQENVSFDHYFGTYPNAANLPGENPFKPKRSTPTSINTLKTPLDPTHHFAPIPGVNLTSPTQNPNSLQAANFNINPAIVINGVAGRPSNSPTPVAPFRMSAAQASTADQDHNYPDEQRAMDDGGMDMFPATVGAQDSAASPTQPQVAPFTTTSVVLGYFDGNTVTAMWNYAQHFALNDNSYGTTFGPSAPGAINLVSGQTNGVVATNAAANSPCSPSTTPCMPIGTIDVSNFNFGGEADVANDGHGGASLTSDAQPLGDVCSNRDQVRMGGKNIGDLLNAAHVSWGFFEGGFDLTVINPDGSTGCNRTTTSAITQVKKGDYIPHHQPFQFYASTANPNHTRPASIAEIGNAGPANHQYDIHDFFDAVSAGNFPAVSFLKAPAYQDGHAQYSDPIDEQNFIVTTINFLQKSPEWRHTAVIIAYDDSDGWYDHQMPPIVNPSNNLPMFGTFTVAGVPGFNAAGDFLNSMAGGICNSGAQQGTPTPPKALAGATVGSVQGVANAQGRCGYGPRLPLLVISPFAKSNVVDHTLTDQTSIIRFVEDNWLHGQRIPGSYDAIAGSLIHMFDFDGPGDFGFGDDGGNRILILDPNFGQIVMSQPQDDDDN
jgi:phospholipase C